jgi:polar amino acid transport system substrate-binding protein
MAATAQFALLGGETLMLPKMLLPATRVLPTLALLAGLSTTAAFAKTNESYWQGIQKARAMRCGATVGPPYVMSDPAT